MRAKRGQVLVVVAIALLALLAFVALAIDGGSVYEHRRIMQNAADAGALAGAQEICFGNPANAEAAALDYAINRNDADDAHFTLTGDFTVTVVTTQTVDTYFAGLIGFDVFTVTADASALCGKAAAAGGIWPVGFDKDRWDYADAHGQITCNKTLIIWEGGRADCDTFDCCHVVDQGGHLLPVDISCDHGVPEAYPLDNRAWVDFSAGISGFDPCDSGGCGADEIVDRIDGETKIGNTWHTCESFVVFPDCFANPSGEKTNAWKAVENSAGEIHTIPLYDPCQSSIPAWDDPSEVPEGCPETSSVCTMEHSPGNNCTNERYFIDELACLRIGVNTHGNSWTATGYVLRKPEAGPGTPRARVMVATIPCDEEGNPPEECGTAPGWTTGDPPEPGDVKAVSLIE